MKDLAIEHKTVFSFDHGEITRYDTNVPCGDLAFDFTRPMVTMMLSGEKTISWNGGQLSFKPNTVFIPPNKEQMLVDIQNASKKMPTSCIVLDMDNAFIQSLYYEVVERWNPEWVPMKVSPNLFYESFTTQELDICGVYLSLYKNFMNTENAPKTVSFLLDLKLRELVFSLLRERSQKTTLSKDVIDDGSPIAEVINYINKHFRTPIAIPSLTKMACMSNAIFFKKFKALLGCSPVAYIIKKRIEFSKTLLANTLQPIGEIVYHCGFQSFEHFCRKFKASQGITPLEYRLQAQIVA